MLGDRVLVVNRNPVLERGRRVATRDHPARPHRAARAPERAERARVDHQHAARADPRVPQPAPHDLRPGAARGVRRGVPPRRHAEPPPRGDLRRRARPRRGPGRRGAADRQDQPRCRARCRPRDRRRQPPAPARPGAVDRRQHRARQPRRQRRGRARCRSAAARSRSGSTSTTRSCAWPSPTPGRACRPTSWGRSSAAAGAPRSRRSAAGVSGSRSCRSSASVGAARSRSGAGDDGAGAVFEADLPGASRRGAGSGGRVNDAAEVAVLVVDDDFMVARIHTQFVERTPGFRVVGVASSGQAALDDVARLRPDLVLLDVHLPDMTGIDVLRRLRADGDDVGVLVVTAAREADTVRAAASGGAVHYLVKPFDYDDLRVRLESFRTAHLALSGARRSGPGGHRRRLRCRRARRGRGPAQGAEPGDRRGGRGRAGRCRRALGGRVRRGGRHLAGLRAPLPRALRRPRRRRSCACSTAARAVPSGATGRPEPCSPPCPFSAGTTLGRGGRLGA